MTTHSPYRFMAWVLLLMVPFFGLWYALGNLPAAPAFVLARYVLEWGLPDVIDSVSLDQTRMLVVTAFGEHNGTLLPAQQAGHQMAFAVDTRLVSYSIPFYAALLFASGVSQPLERFCRGLIILWLLMALGLLSIQLKNLMLGLQETLFAQAAMPLPPPAVIALLYQLSTLIVPTLAPALVWLWAARDAPLLASFTRSGAAAAGTDATANTGGPTADRPPD